MDWYTILEELKTKLAAIVGVTSCKIGVETDLSPADYPIVRLVPTQFSKTEPRKQKMALTIYYGAAVTEADGGLEAVYQSLLAMESAIKAAVHFGNGYQVNFIDTITDEDRLEHFKIFASRFEVVG